MPMAPRLRSLVAVVAASVLAGCAATGTLRCAGDQQAVISDLIYFGTQSPAGVVSEKAWSDFLREEVTPRFPAGLSVWKASGQWLGRDEQLAREDSFVLSLVHPGDHAAETAVRDLIAEYKTRFRQEAVLRVKSPACSSL